MLRRLVRAPRVLLLLAFGSSSVINYAFGLAMGWLLLPGDFGLLAFAQTLLLVAALILNSGISTSLTAAIVGVPVPRRAALVRGALVANLALAACISSAIVLLFALGPLRVGLETMAMTGIVALTLPFIALIATANAAAQGAERFGVVAMIQIVEIGCKAIGGLTLALGGCGPAGAMAGFLIGAIVGALLGLYHLNRTLDVRPWGAVDLPSVSTIGPMFGALLGMAVLLNVDLVALRLFSGSQRMLTGYYQAGTILANTPYYLVAGVLVPVLFPQLARLQTLAATREIVGRALRLVALAVLPIELVLAYAPRTALQLFFPPAYAPGAPALRLLAIGNSALVMLAILATAFQATGQAKVPARILLTATACEAIALMLAVPRWHLVGAATVFVATASLALLGLGVAYLRALRAALTVHVAVWCLRYGAALGIATLAGAAIHVLGGSTIPIVGLAGLSYLAAVFPLNLVSRPRAIRRTARLVERPTATERENAPGPAAAAVSNGAGATAGEPLAVHPYDLSAVIVNYNSGHLLPRCIGALRQACGSLRLEIIVVDNGSTDGSLGLLDDTCRPAHVLQLGSNAGFGHAVNAGLALARGRYYLLLNPDCFVRPDLPGILIRRLDADPHAAMVGPQLLNANGTLQPSCHNFPRPLVLLLEQSMLWRWLRRVPFVNARLLIAGDHTRPAGVDWLTGACLLVRPEAWTAVGGLDELFFLYWEEVDLCWRLRRAGWTVLYEPAAQAIHIGGGSTNGHAPLLQFFVSLYLFYAKHYAGNQLALARAVVWCMATYRVGRACITWLLSASTSRRLAAATDIHAWRTVAALRCANPTTPFMPLVEQSQALGVPNGSHLAGAPVRDGPALHHGRRAAVVRDLSGDADLHCITLPPGLVEPASPDALAGATRPTGVKA